MRIAVLAESAVSGWPETVQVRHCRTLSALVHTVPWADGVVVDGQAHDGGWLRRARRLAGGLPVRPLRSDLVGLAADLADASIAEVPAAKIVVSHRPWEALEVRQPDAFWIAVTRPCIDRPHLDATSVPLAPGPTTVSPLQLEAIVMRTLDLVHEGDHRVVVLDDLFVLQGLHDEEELLRFCAFLAHKLEQAGVCLEIGVRPGRVGRLVHHLHGDRIDAEPEMGKVELVETNDIHLEATAR